MEGGWDLNPDNLASTVWLGAVVENKWEKIHVWNAALRLGQRVTSGMRRLLFETQFPRL